MANYAYLQQIKDPASRQLLRMLIDQVASLSGRADGGVVWRNNVNAGGVRVTNAADGIEEDDFATVRQVEASVMADVLRRRLEAGGDAELNVSGLAGRLSEPQYMGIEVIPNDQSLPNVNTALPYAVVSWQGKLYYFSPLSNPGRWVVLTTAASIIADTHANRLALYPASAQSTGTMFWETDRTALYYISTAAGVNTWRLMMSRPYFVALASRPADLGSADSGFLVSLSDQGNVIQEWSGSAWFWHQGILNDTFANRPLAGATNQGFRFRATDRGYQTWRSTSVVWVLEEGVGGPMRGTLIAVDQRPAGLTANDVGFRFEATDANVLYRWTGVAWALAPTQVLAGHLEMAAAQTFTTATPAQVVYGTTVLDQGPVVSGNTVVVPANCGGTPTVWHLVAQAEWDTNAVGVRTLEILQAGTPIAASVVMPSATDTVVQQVTAIAFNPAAATAFSVRGTQNSGGNLDMLEGSFKAYKVA